jgi:hypothetical protein
MTSGGEPAPNDASAVASDDAPSSRLYPRASFEFERMAFFCDAGLGHHRFVSRLRAVSRPLMYATLVYLAFVAFLPFPAAVLGAYDDNPVGVAFYAASLAILSGLEGVTFCWRGARTSLPNGWAALPSGGRCWRPSRPWPCS